MLLLVKALSLRKKTKSGANYTNNDTTYTKTTSPTFTFLEEGQEYPKILELEVKGILKPKVTHFCSVTIMCQRTTNRTRQKN